MKASARESLQAVTAYRGETSDGYHFVFYPKWAKGIGLIGPKSMILLTEMVA